MMKTSLYNPSNKTEFVSRLTTDIQKFNSELRNIIEKKFISSTPKKLKQAIVYSLFPGGKRIRPIIMFAVGEMLNVNRKTLTQIACSIELIHNYSLIHDDLPSMDNDDYRRGKLTVHKKFNEAIAILTGDALLTLAFELLSEILNVSAKKILQIVKLVSEYIGFNGLIAGQVLDIESNKVMITKNFNEKKKLINKIHINKTAKLIELCVVIPAIVKGVKKEQLDLLHKIGCNLGLLFQITDDLIDNLTGQDKNKLTWPEVYGVKETKSTVGSLVEELKDLIIKNFGVKKSWYLLNIIDLVAKRQN